MTLTVRLKPELEASLEFYCAERGATKSLVVQEALAEYLVGPRESRPSRSEAARSQPGPTYLTFERLGLIGAGTLDGRSATKDVVRERIKQNLERKRSRRP